MTHSNARVVRIEDRKGPNVCISTIGQFSAFVKHDGGLVLRGTQKIKEDEYLRAAAKSQTGHFSRLRHRREERPRALPVPQGSRVVVNAGPPSRSAMPAGRVECLARLLEMMSHERRALVELVGVELLDDRGDSAMEPSTTGTQLRVIRYFLCQWVLERVLRFRIERLLVEKLCCDQCPEGIGNVGFGSVADALQYRLGDLFADDRRGLYDFLLALRQPVDARSK